MNGSHDIRHKTVQVIRGGVEGKPGNGLWLLLQKALSARGNPRLDNISAIMRAMGYQLLPQRIEQHAV